MKSIIKYKSLGILLVLVLMVIILAILSPAFLTTDNIFNVIRSFSFVALMAIGVTLTILTGGIDLSVGSILGLCGCLTAILMNMGLPVPVALILGLASGAFIGFINGRLIAGFRIPPFIVTLGMLSMARGLAFVVTKGWPVSGLPESFLKIGQGYLWIIPIPVLFLAFIVLLMSILLNRTALGRYFYALGGNEEAARLSGVPVGKVKTMAYVLSGFLSAFAGILLVARLGVAQSIVGQGYELDAIAASVIGGTSLMGGIGTISGVIIGAAIMGVLRNGLVLMGISAFWQQIALGAIIVIAVALDKNRA